MTHDGTVTVLIPAYEAAGFIDRTLGLARAQTYENQRILVSVDRSADETEEICRGHAGQDDRIEVVNQPERLGWAGNVNFLLDTVRSEFCFLYFHDDRIEPTYSERLLSALRRRPDAASAHCDMGHFGEGAGKLSPGRALDGPDAVRLLDFLTAEGKPSLLRSMLRSELAADIRMPTAGGGVWANQPFLMGLVAAGPAVHVPETLYLRWNKRGGGLTDAWRSLPFEEILAGYRENAEAGLAVIDGLRATAPERELLELGLRVHLMLRLRGAEIRYGENDVTPAEALHPRLAGADAPEALAALDPALRAQCEDGLSRLERRTKRARRKLARK